MRPAAVPVKSVPSTSAFVARCKQCAPCRSGRVGIGVPPRHPLRMAELDRVVQYVAGDDAVVADPHTEMPGCVSRRHLEVDVACECRVGFHRFDKPGVDHGPDGIGEHGRAADHVSATSAPSTIGEDTHGGISRVQDSGSVRVRSRYGAAFR